MLTRILSITIVLLPKSYSLTKDIYSYNQHLWNRMHKGDESLHHFIAVIMGALNVAAGKLVGDIRSSTELNKKHAVANTAFI